MTVSDLGFTLDRTYAATPERVYAYFTDPELMAPGSAPTRTCRSAATSTSGRLASGGS